MVRDQPPHSHREGSTVFRFAGHGELPRADLGLPLLPVRLASPGDRSGFLVNAVVDSGATRTVIPFELAEDLSLGNLRFDDHLATAGGEARAAPATIRLDIVDSYFPSVLHWRFDALPVEVAEPSVDLTLPLIGWDLLHRFETCFHPQEGFLLLRGAPRPS